MDKATLKFIEGTMQFLKDQGPAEAWQQYMKYQYIDNICGAANMLMTIISLLLIIYFGYKKFKNEDKKEYGKTEEVFFSTLGISFVWSLIFPIALCFLGSSLLRAYAIKNLPKGYAIVMIQETLKR